MLNKKELLREIQILGFALAETNLFLDTHPSNQKALEFFKKTQKQYTDAVADYTKNYGPLTAFSGEYDDRFTWVNGPWPWELQEEVRD